MYDDAEEVQSIVFGAGLAGMAAATTLAEHNSPGGLRTVVLERGSKERYRDTTPSQGNLRGSRLVQQSPALMEAILRTWDYMAQLEKKHGKMIMTGREHPFLMVVEKANDVNTITQNYHANLQTIRKEATENNDSTMLRILNKFNETDKLTFDNISDAREKYGLNFPVDYAGVINAPESTTLDLDAYFEIMGKELKEHNGEVRHGVIIEGYQKRNDGRHLVITNENGKKESYLAKDLIVCTGSDISQTLAELKSFHDAAAAIKPEECAPVANVPERFDKENCVEVPQRVLHIQLPSHCKPKPLCEETIYFLDVPNNDRTGSPNLGVYLFREPKPDGKPGSDIIKIGYDPMGRTIEDGSSGSAMSAAQDDKKFTAQETIVLAYASELYDVPQGQLIVVQRDKCSYPTDVTRSPAVGFMPSFHGIGIIEGLMGYGAMAGKGLAKKIVSGSQETENGLLDPERRITGKMRNKFFKEYDILALSKKAATILRDKTQSTDEQALPIRTRNSPRKYFGWLPEKLGGTTYPPAFSLPASLQPPRENESQSPAPPGFSEFVMGSSSNPPVPKNVRVKPSRENDREGGIRAITVTDDANERKMDCREHEDSALGKLLLTCGESPSQYWNFTDDAKNGWQADRSDLVRQKPASKVLQKILHQGRSANKGKGRDNTARGGK